MPWSQALASSGVALGVGLLVGIERERASARTGDDWFGGVRTYPLMGLLGALLGILARSAGSQVLVPGLLAAGSLLFAPALLELRAGERRGITSEIACTLVLALGVVSGSRIPGLDDPERWRVVLACGIVAMAMLSLRNPLHRLASHVSSADLYATAKLAVLLIVVLPLLPDVGYGPGGRLNPSSAGMLVSLIAAIGFAGYLAVRALGSTRGMAITGLLGGLASSTAVTLNFSGRVRRQPELAPAAALGVVLASAMMVPRMLVLVAVVSPSLELPALAPIGGMGLLAFAMAGALYLRHRRKPDTHARVEMANPFSLGQALRFGAIYVLVLLATGIALERFGTGALYLAAALAGLSSVDAITLSVAQLHAHGLAASTSVTALLVAGTANTLVKAGLALLIGRWEMGWRVVGILLPMLLFGGVALLLRVAP